MGYVRARLDQRQSHAGFTNTYVAWDFCMFSKVFILTWTKKCSSLYWLSLKDHIHQHAKVDFGIGSQVKSLKEKLTWHARLLHQTYNQVQNIKPLRFSDRPPRILQQWHQSPRIKWNIYCTAIKLTFSICICIVYVYIYIYIQFVCTCIGIHVLFQLLTLPVANMQF